jgi:hypothetical protein
LGANTAAAKTRLKAIPNKKNRMSALGNIFVNFERARGKYQAHFQNLIVHCSAVLSSVVACLKTDAQAQKTARAFCAPKLKLQTGPELSLKCDRQNIFFDGVSPYLWVDHRCSCSNIHDRGLCSLRNIFPD